MAERRSSAGGGNEGAAALPARRIRHWTPQTKARVVRAIEEGLIPMAEAVRRYELSEEEYQLWRDGLAHHGLHGLSVTRLTRLRCLIRRPGGFTRM